jgi:hypothetical protein
LQLTPHEPQWPASFWRFEQTGFELTMQTSKFGWHLHVALSQIPYCGHAFPQAPQFDVSLNKSTQALPHTIFPAGHWQDPLLHSAPEAHGIPQAPQFTGSLLGLVQMPEQRLGVGAPHPVH